MDSHPLALIMKSAGRTAHNSKTVVVVTIIGVVVVAVGRATIPSIVVPRTTAQQPELPVPFLPPGFFSVAIDAAKSQ